MADDDGEIPLDAPDERIAQTLPVRLRFGQEGALWVCYVEMALDGETDRRVLGSLAMPAARASTQVRDQFVALMKTAVTLFINEATGGATPPEALVFRERRGSPSWP